MSGANEDIIRALYDCVAKLDDSAVAGKSLDDLGKLLVSELVLDSLEMLELGMMISERFDTEVDILELPPEATCYDICDTIALQLQ